MFISHPGLRQKSMCCVFFFVCFFFFLQITETGTVVLTSYFLIYSDMLKGNKLHFYRMSSYKIAEAGSEGIIGRGETAKLLVCICCD